MEENKKRTYRLEENYLVKDTYPIDIKTYANNEKTAYFF